ncbi:MAG: hypothetical protein ACTHOG_12845 [Marmoricola sp.]
MSKFRRTRRVLAGLNASASLFVVWALASATAFGLGALISRLGGSESGAAALAGPPLALAFALALRALLRRSLRGYEARAAEEAARREGEELLRDPEFLESLNQMTRGEGTIVRARDEKENPDG